MTGVAVVTGAASGIGKASGERLAEHGPVLLVDVSDAVHDVASALRATGHTVHVVVVDVASSLAGLEIAEAAVAAGGVRALVNAAGITIEDDHVERADDAALERIFAVNVLSIIRLGRCLVPIMRDGGGGVIINVASVHAFASMTDYAAYAATKGAIVALSRQMAIDLAPSGIRVLAVAPGSVDTPMTRLELARRGVTAEEAGFAVSSTGIGRVMAPSEIAAVISWMASMDAACVNGTTVIADAGLLARLV